MSVSTARYRIVVKPDSGSGNTKVWDGPGLGLRTGGITRPGSFCPEISYSMLATPTSSVAVNVNCNVPPGATGVQPETWKGMLGAAVILGAAPTQLDPDKTPWRNSTSVAGVVVAPAVSANPPTGTTAGITSE